MKDIIPLLLSSGVVATILKCLFDMKRKSNLQIANENFVKILIYYIHSKKAIDLNNLLELRRDIADCYGIKIWRLYSIKQAYTIARIICLTTEDSSIEEKNSNDTFWEASKELFKDNNSLEKEDERLRRESRKKIVKDIGITFLGIFIIFFIITLIAGYNSGMSILEIINSMFSWEEFLFVIGCTVVGVIGAYGIPYLFKKIFGLIADF